MKITELLVKAAEQEKLACESYVTEFTKAGIVSLVKGGVPFEKAAQLIGEACGTDPKVASFKTNILTFEKTAEYIAELEEQVQELTKVAEEATVTVKALDEKDPLNKLAAAGFSPEELAMMAHLPNDLIEKVANSNAAPWEMGGGAGIAREKTDPFLEFLVN
jgi:hypothetical protein